MIGKTGDLLLILSFMQLDAYILTLYFDLLLINSDCWSR